MAKRLELLNEIAPRAAVFTVLINPKNPYAPISMKEAQDAARVLGKEIHIVHASSADELDSVFATLSQLKADALLIAPDGLFIIRAAQVAALSVSHWKSCVGHHGILARPTVRSGSWAVQGHWHMVRLPPRPP